MMYVHERCVACAERAPVENLVDYLGLRYCTTCYRKVITFGWGADRYRAMGIIPTPLEFKTMLEAREAKKAQRIRRENLKGRIARHKERTPIENLV